MTLIQESVSAEGQPPVAPGDFSAIIQEKRKKILNNANNDKHTNLKVPGDHLAVPEEWRVIPQAFFKSALTDNSRKLKGKNR